MEINPGMRLFRRGRTRRPEFLPDSPEQIARSINLTGLRTEIDQAVRAAIARAREQPRKSYVPTIDEAREVDLGNGAF